jgi:hypothetical protein
MNGVKNAKYVSHRKKEKIVPSRNSAGPSYEHKYNNTVSYLRSKNTQAIVSSGRAEPHCRSWPRGALCALEFRNMKLILVKRTESFLFSCE